MMITLTMALFFPFFSSSAGIYYLEFFDAFVADINLPFGALVELYLFVYIFNFESYETEVERNVGIKTPGFIKWALKSKAMIVVLAGVVVLGASHQVMLYEKYSTGKYMFGWLITLYPHVIALVYWRLYREEVSRTTFEEIEQY